VKFPRVQGIECVGMVEEDASGKYKKGQQVAAIMGGMGRDFDGGYAEFQTVSGSLRQALEVRENEVLLIRGGTSSIGMLACQLAKHL